MDANPIPVDPPGFGTFNPWSPSKPCKCHWFQTPPSPEFKAMKSSPLLGPFGDSKFWGFSLLMI